MENIASACSFRKYSLLRAEEGLFRIHPIETGTKKPHLRGYRQLATRNFALLAKWAEKWPHANIGGIIPDRLAILDVDLRNGGDNSLAELVHQNGLFEQTVTVKTPSGGAHYYFFLSADVQLKSCTKLGPGLELLSSGWNILLPGSIGSNGKAYEYEVAPLKCKVAPVPSWLLNLAFEAQAKKQSGTLAPGSHTGRGDSFSLPVVIPHGERNRTLVSYAASLRARGFDEEEIHSLLLKTNTDRCRPPLEKDEVENIAQWAGSKPIGRSTASPEALAAFANLEIVIRATAWSGRFGFSCRRAAESMLALMREKGKTAVDADVRSMALRVGRSPATVARCLRALSGRERKKAHSIPHLFDCRTTRLHSDFIQFSDSTARHEQSPHCYSISVHIANLIHTPQSREGGLNLYVSNWLCLTMYFAVEKG